MFGGSVLLVWTIAGFLSPKSINVWKLSLFWFCQPILIWQWVGNGQFDVLWLIFLLIAILYSIKKCWWMVIVSLIIGIWIKFIPLLMAPWFALWWWQDTNKLTWKKNIFQAVIGLGISVFITAVSWKPFWEGIATLQPVALQTKWAVGSIFSVLYFSLKPTFSFLFETRAHWILTRLIHLTVGVAALWLVYPVIKKGFYILIKQNIWQPINYISAIFVSMLIYLSVWQKSFWPWYIAWLLPLGLIIFLNNRLFMLNKILVWISLSPLFFYAVWAINHATRNTDAPSELWFQWLIVCVIWVYPLIQL
jgi:alpha-1,6-mannosyltransferase